MYKLYIYICIYAGSPCLLCTAIFLLSIALSSYDHFFLPFYVVVEIASHTLFSSFCCCFGITLHLISSLLPRHSLRTIPIPTQSPIAIAYKYKCYKTNAKESIDFYATLRHDATRFSRSNLCLFGVHRCHRCSWRRWEGYWSIDRKCISNHETSQSSALYISQFFFSRGEECDRSTCPGPLTYYERLKCTPVYENEGDCCAKKYNCDHLKDRSRDKCYVNDKVYEIGENLKPEDMDPCEVTCTCRRGFDNV